MTTRRDVIKAGAGLAAILASGKAPATIVKSMLGARGAFLAARRKAKLPYDAEVEYLESTRTQYIDLDLDSTADDFCDFDISYALTNTATSTIPPFGYQYGASARYGMWGVSTVLYVGADNAHRVNFSASGNKTDVSLRNGEYVEINGTRQPIGAGTVRGGIGLCLFGINRVASGAGNLNFAWARVYSFTIFARSGLVLRDFQPVRFTNELGVSEGAMFDRANPTVGMDPYGAPRTDGLYRNRGTGAFTVGPDKA